MSLNQIIVTNEIDLENLLFMVEQKESSGVGEEISVVKRFKRIIIKQISDGRTSNGQQLIHIKDVTDSVSYL